MMKLTYLFFPCSVRASVREMEPLTEGRQRRNWSKPPYAERTNMPSPDIRRSVSLPRGKNLVA